MRRGPGIAGLQHAVRTKEQYKVAGEEVKKNSLQAMHEQLSAFRSNLEEFARKYRADVRRDPVFRAQFHTMCANIGVDPLASNKSLWASALGFGDYYYELGVQVVEACLASRSLNGGMMELPALLRAVSRRRGGAAEPVSEDDVVRAIKKLRVLGGGFDLVTIGGRAYVRSVPGELNLDKNRALEAAQARGYTSVADLAAAAGWSAGRADDTLQALTREGLAWVDDGAPDGVRLYWFPCLSGAGGSAAEEQAAAAAGAAESGPAPG
ncbi:hypothetical protein CHLRE_17g706650v5 [Chlamydomonas reinhardtii]|uniref:Uncharacterized protein n=1 Tax=Chlamydomonas reinhardtii TaxID=3055 RepID=A8IRC0_CHLRE|nr:uncharacterized protein CHLRE_17g706650v5 [Chlamydomonas reinhardtii]PNW70123.1 hypothetical protein CHLRE_17g706650v5 [Chlamydomonas reinhardtii]|eukprot:XP_001691712.1 subunit of ESCRT-II complex [Chlamydomonas reinhardtii]